MNETLKLLHDRKSVRAFEDKAIPEEIKSALFEAALQAPSAGNMCLYTILDITDPGLKAALAESCDHQPFIAAAPLVLVFCADYQRWYDSFCRHLSQVRRPAEGDMFLAMADALIAAQNLAVAAESFGLGSCYIGDITENFEYHRELLKLPPYVVPACMLVLGYPTEQQMTRPKPPRFPASDIVHENGYSEEKSGRMDEMLQQRQDMGLLDFEDWLGRFCERKWNSDFSREMSRSCREMLRSFCGGDS